MHRLFQLFGVGRDLQNDTNGTICRRARLQTTYIMGVPTTDKPRSPCIGGICAHTTDRSLMVLVAKVKPHLLTQTKMLYESRCGSCSMGYLRRRIR